MSTYKPDQPVVIGYANSVPASKTLFSLHSANKSNKAPITLVTGNTGSGKTYCMLWLTTLAAIQGATIVGIDWKGDLLKLAGAEDITGVPVRRAKIDPTDPENIGILDPFIVFSHGEDKKQIESDTVTAVLAVLQALLPNSVNDDIIVGQISNTVRDILNFHNDEKCMIAFLDELQRTASLIDDPVGRSKLFGFAKAARNALTAGAGEILSAEPDKGEPKYIKFQPGITVIDLSDLHELPKTIDELKDPSKAVGQAIMTMLTLLIRQSMFRLDESIRKVLVVDEAWSIITNPTGAALIDTTARLGRSKNLALLLGTQNYTDIFNERTRLNKAFASTHFAFNNSEDDAIVAANAMQVKGDAAAQVVEAITTLPQGWCLMRDIRGRRGQVRIDIWLEELPEIFNTNPLTDNT